MAQVTIGVPVFNGGKYLRDCLECLRRQTFEDFEVLIADNASTDDTAEIAREFCERDSRFHYTRHPVNVGFVPNFMGLLEKARSPYFLWRAHDDICSPDWVEVLVGALDCDPNAILAISRVRLESPEGVEQRTVPAPVTFDRSRPEIARELLAGRCFAWFWGVWRRAPLVSIMRFTAERYANPWGIDMVALFPAMASGRTASSDEVTFHSRVNPESVSQTMLKDVDLAFRWSYQRAYRRQILEAWAALDRTAIPPEITIADVDRHITLIAGKRRFTKNLFRQPKHAITSLYQGYKVDFARTSKTRAGNAVFHINLDANDPQFASVNEALSIADEGEKRAKATSTTYIVQTRPKYL